MTEGTQRAEGTNSCIMAEGLSDAMKKAGGKELLAHAVFSEISDETNHDYAQIAFESAYNAATLTMSATDDVEVAGSVGMVGSMPGTVGFTMAAFEASKVPVGTKLYTSPQRSPDTQVGDAVQEGIEALEELIAWANGAKGGFPGDKAGSALAHLKQVAKQ